MVLMESGDLCTKKYLASYYSYFYVLLQPQAWTPTWPTAIRDLRRSWRTARPRPMSCALELLGMIAAGRSDSEIRSGTVEQFSIRILSLPDGAREAFILFRFEGHSCAEIAEITGTPKKTVESRLTRAVQILSERLKRHAPEFSAE